MNLTSGARIERGGLENPGDVECLGEVIWRGKISGADLNIASRSRLGMNGYGICLHLYSRLYGAVRGAGPEPAYAGLARIGINQWKAPLWSVLWRANCCGIMGRGSIKQ